MILQVLLPLILAFIMFSLILALVSRGSDFSRVLKFPVPFLAGLLNQVVLLPLVALGLSYIFKLDPNVNFCCRINDYCHV